MRNNGDETIDLQEEEAAAAAEKRAQLFWTACILFLFLFTYSSLWCLSFLFVAVSTDTIYPAYLMESILLLMNSDVNFQ